MKVEANAYDEETSIVLGVGRPPVRKRSHNNLFRRKNLRIGDMKQDMHREREREAQRMSILTIWQQLQNDNNNLY